MEALPSMVVVGAPRELEAEQGVVIMSSIYNQSVSFNRRSHHHRKVLRSLSRKRVLEQGLKGQVRHVQVGKGKGGCCKRRMGIACAGVWIEKGLPAGGS